MILMPIRFTVEGQKLEIVGNPFVVADSFDYLTAEFRFYAGYDWENAGIVKKAIFQLGTGTPYEVTLANDETVKTDHLNLTDGVWKISVVGYEVSGQTLVERITTNKVELLVVESGSTEGEPFPESLRPAFGYSANEIKFTPVGTMTATDVQAAITELYALINP